MVSAVLIRAVNWKWSRRRVLLGLAGILALASGGYWLVSRPPPLERLRRKLEDPSTDLKEAWSLHANFCARYPDTQKADDLMWRYLLALRASDPGRHARVVHYELTKLPSPLDQLPEIKNPYYSDVVAVLRKPDEPKIHQLAVSADCKRVAGSRADGTIDVWDAATGAKLFSLPGEGKYATAMAFSPHDENMLVMAANDSTVTVWELANRRKRALQPPKATRFAFSPNGKKLALAGPGMILWEVRTGRTETLINELNAQGSLAGFSLDGRTLAWTNGNGPPTLWDLEANKERVIAGLPQAVNLAFAPSSRTIAIGGNNVPIRIWDLVRQKQIGVPLGKPPAQPVAFSADGSKLITYTTDEGNRLMDVESGQELWRFGSHGLIPTLAPDDRAECAQDRSSRVICSLARSPMASRSKRSASSAVKRASSSIGWRRAMASPCGISRSEPCWCANIKARCIR